MGVKKSIENEYLTMIDQVIIASDVNLNILYNNYHEKFYDKIMSKIIHLVNLDPIRTKANNKLDRCFKPSSNTLDTDQRTMKILMKMYDAFEFDSSDPAKTSYYQKAGILDLLLSLESYIKQVKSANERKSVKQLNIESRRSQYASLKLIVA